MIYAAHTVDWDGIKGCKGRNNWRQTFSQWASEERKSRRLLVNNLQDNWGAPF